MPLYKDRKGKVLCPGCDKVVTLGNSDVSIPKPKKPEPGEQSASGLQFRTADPGANQAGRPLQDSSSGLFSQAKVYPSATLQASNQSAEPEGVPPNFTYQVGTTNPQTSQGPGFAFASNFGSTQPKVPAGQYLPSFSTPFAALSQPSPQSEIASRPR